VSRPPIEVEVGAEEDGERADRVLAARGVATRSAVQRWMAEGRVTRDGEALSPKTKVRAGDRILAVPSPPPPSRAEPQAIPLEILHEDPHLLVVVKRAGLVVHPAPGHPDGTLVNALLYHSRFEDHGDPLRPGIVHRLDKDTSGVMVVAKTIAAREGLVGLFQAHDIERRYDALAVGTKLPQQITFDTLHGRHPVDRKRFSSRVERGKRAVTHVEVVQTFEVAQQVACTLETGRTHQIRVHLADHGSPLLGDPTYGKTPPALRVIAAELGRQALHAAVLGFVHPVTGERLRFEAPPPRDFEAALAALS